MADRVRLALLLLLNCSISFSASTNDFFANRVILTGTAPSANADYSEATVEPGEPHEYPSSLWWEWTSSVERGAYLRVQSGLNALVYTGTWPNLTLVSTSNVALNPDFATFRAHPGETYYLAAAGLTSAATSLGIQLQLAVTNDDFATARVIAGTNVESSVRMEGSTVEAGEPLVGTNTVGTVWWKWTPGTTNRAVIEFSHRDQWLNAAVYRGTSLTDLERVAVVTERFSQIFQDRASRITMHPEDTTYYIAVENIGNYPQLAPRLWIWPGQPNDDFQRRITLPSKTDTRTNGGVYGATLEADEPRSGSTNVSIWYEWTAPTNGSVAISTHRQDSIPALEVFSGDALTNLMRVAPHPSLDASRYLSLRTVPGQTYMLRVNGQSSQLGEVTVNIKPGPSNDDFARATTFQRSQFLTSGSLLGATFELGELVPSNSIGGSAWWKWIPTNSGLYSLEVSNLLPSFSHNFVLDVYTGDSLTNLVWLSGVSSLNSHTNARTTIRTVAGKEYYLRVADQDLLASYNGTINFLLNANPASEPPQFEINTSDGDGVLNLNLSLQPNSTTTVEVSTNLSGWQIWTNFTSSVSAVWSQQIPLSTNEPSQFFRARIQP